MSFWKKCFFIISFIALLFIFSFNGIIYALSNGLVFKEVEETAPMQNEAPALPAPASEPELQVPGFQVSEARVKETPEQLHQSSPSPSPAPMPDKFTPPPEDKTMSSTVPEPLIRQKTPSSPAQAAVSGMDSSMAFKGSPVKNGSIQLLPWFGGAERVFAIGRTAVVYDVETGVSFRVKRTYGYNHADVETLTLTDTEILKWITSGIWNWSRRAVIVEVDGVEMAASMSAMPHAGLDGVRANTWVNSRSAGYNSGANLDSVKGNEMDGHIDIHFFQSRTHETNRVDEKHQEMVMKAYRVGKK